MGPWSGFRLMMSGWACGGMVVTVMVSNEFCKGRFRGLAIIRVAQAHASLT